MSASDSGSSRRKVAERSDDLPSLPHDRDREEPQPYARELEDYRHGVIAPPEEQVGQEPNRRTPRKRTNKPAFRFSTPWASTSGLQGQRKAAITASAARARCMSTGVASSRA